ncbi:uncharacterized protein YfbU (UPF0304 family) [Scopulibacillus daqui]|uniref:Uncharacterized protein YfbU (UPF0304 family) n=1 Tax=Scopulibacillus daqui TaxID=1469162 RepID=A0ABS2PVJ2_9BACL|nr:YfbU family protein [Scopulibacillus daqui]MBM7644067.1 uncharacterized protein YfbU (UPF0304 family) [Scopulibacillus daqui]
MELSKVERLILFNQFSILEQLNAKDAPYSYYKEILEHGYTYNYDELVEFLLDDVPREVCDEVWDILQMHRSIIHSYNNLESKDDIKFKGFDGNEETEHMTYARFIIENMNRFEEQKLADYNTHFPTLNRYRRMLSEWRKISERYNSHLTVEQIKQIINA